MKPTRPRVLVTGGGSGIGLAIARAFVSGEYDVLIAGRDEARLRETGIPYVVMDVCDADSLPERIARAGPIDVFVANAGGVATAPALRTPRDTWQQMMTLNLTSVFDCARLAVPPMVERGWGRFLAIGSTASLKGYPYVAAYAAAKHGALGFVRSLALELAKTGVTANAICPGYTDTPLVAGAIDAVAAKTGRKRDEITAAFTVTNPMGRFVTPEEVAGAALWLASDSAASVNGQAIVIDGGGGQ